MSEFSTRALDRDGEVQASLVVAQLERRRPMPSRTRAGSPSLAVRVAQLARLPESEIRQVYWGGLVHDIGELDVPEPILATPGPLAVARTPDGRRAPVDRRRAGSRHARARRRSCRTRAGTTSASTARGYPDGRGGHEVPLTVALVAVCDCWDAMTEPRPYRDTLSLDGRRRRDAAAAPGRQWSRVLVDWLLETVAMQSRGHAADRLSRKLR